MLKSLRKQFTLLILPTVVGSMLCAASAMADTVSILGFQIESMSIQGKLANGTNGFTGVHDTGDLILKATARTAAEVDIDGVTQETLASRNAPTTFDLSGDIQLGNGLITGGIITLIAHNPSSTDTYQFDIAPWSGSLVKVPFVNDYLLAGLTYNGIFSSGSFGGVDVNFWKDQQPVLGSFLQFNYNPTSTGADTSANLDVAVFGESLSPRTQQPDVDPPSQVPMPKTVWSGLALIAGMALMRVRNRANVA